jgi:hypothetical protein
LLRSRGKTPVIYIGPGYIKDIKNWPRPKNKKEVERFLGFTNYHRAFIEEYTPNPVISLLD